MELPWMIGAAWIVHGNPWILPHLDRSMFKRRTVEGI
jgi:hypothetical protein